MGERGLRSFNSPDGRTKKPSRVLSRSAGRAEPIRGRGSLERRPARQPRARAAASAITVQTFFATKGGRKGVDSAGRIEQMAKGEERSKEKASSEGVSNLGNAGIPFFPFRMEGLKNGIGEIYRVSTHG